MRFTHKDCGGLIVVYLNQSFDFYSFLSISKDDIGIENLFIKNINKTPVLYCLGCKQEVIYSLDNIFYFCDSCHEEKPLSEFRFHREEPHYAYCINCIEHHNLHNMNIYPPDKIKF